MIKDKNIVYTEDVNKVLQELGLLWMELFVDIKILNIFKVPIEMKPLVENLQFIKEKKNYGWHLR